MYSSSARKRSGTVVAVGPLTRCSDCCLTNALPSDRPRGGASADAHVAAIPRAANHGRSEKDDQEAGFDATSTSQFSRHWHPVCRIRHQPFMSRKRLRRGVPMSLHKRMFSLGICLAAAAMVSVGSLHAQNPDRAAGGSVHIGIVKSLFRDAPEPLVRALTQPLGLLMKVETGMNGVLSSDATALELGKNLADGKVQIGVFQGIEFAWAKQKYPALRALVLVTDGKPFRRAYLVVSRKGPIQHFADIKGALAMPMFSHEQCYEFVKHCCQKEG